MKNVFKKMLPYLIFFVILFYGAPVVLPSETAPAFLLLVNPLCLLGAGIFYTVKHSFKWYFLIILPVLFIPALFTVYNYTAWVYVPAYLVILAIGQGVGSLIRSAKK